MGDKRPCMNPIFFFIRLFLIDLFIIRYYYLSGFFAVESSITSCENLTSLLRVRRDRGATSATSEENGCNQGIDHKKGSCLKFSVFTSSNPLIKKMSFKEVAVNGVLWV